MSELAPSTRTRLDHTNGISPRTDHDYDALSNEILRLGTLLGDVIKALEGNEIFELEERIRQWAKQSRDADVSTAGATAAREQLHQVIGHLTPQAAYAVANAFTTYFELVNMAEEHYRTEVLRARRADGQLKETIDAALSELKQQGVTATVLIQNGTLNLGDAFVIGKVSGRVRAMYDFRGKRISKAGPSTPISITGLPEVPAAGEVLEVAEDDKAAKALAAQNALRSTKGNGNMRATSLDQYFAMAKASHAKKLELIVKTANQGSLPPLMEQLDKLNTEAVNKENVRLNVIYQGTGQITESDVNLALTSGAVILGFEVPLDSAARQKADANHVDVRLYNVIYKLLEDVELALVGMLPKKIITRVLGTAEVRQIFKIPKIGTIAGSIVRTGTISRNNTARVLRGGEELSKGAVSSLKRLTDDVREVRAGMECGIGLEGFNDIKVGDTIEFIVEEEES